jgi:hypothetical protein
MNALFCILTVCKGMGTSGVYLVGSRATYLTVSKLGYKTNPLFQSKLETDGVVLQEN